MGLPRTFVGFSSTDIREFNMMKAWKEHEHIDFDFCDCQLEKEIFSEVEEYIKRRCRERINMSGTYIMLIGQDTRSKHKYVKWEAEVAIEKKCRIIGVNLDKRRDLNYDLCPSIIQRIGSMFIPFSPHIIKYALEKYERQTTGDWVYKDEIYKELGYALNGNRAEWIPKVPTTLLSAWLNAQRFKS